MIIRFNEDWRISTDPLQWIVQKRRYVKGNERWDNVSYHGTLDGAVFRMADLHIRKIQGEFPADNLIALCHAVDSLKGELVEAVREAGLERSPTRSR